MTGITFVGRWLIVACVVVLGSTGFTHSATVTLVVATSEAEVGSGARVSISARGAQGLGSLQLDLVFDGSLLAAGTVEAGPLLGPGLLAANVVEPGRLRIAFTGDPNQPITGDGVLLIVPFTVTAAGTSSLTLERARAWEQSLGAFEMLVSVEPGQLRAGAGGLPWLWIFLGFAALLLFLIVVVLLLTRSAQGTAAARAHGAIAAPPDPEPAPASAPPSSPQRPSPPPIPTAPPASAPAVTRAVLTCTQGSLSGRRIELGARTTFGRSLDNTVIMNDGTVSGRHAVVSRQLETWMVEDLGSTNGTFVNRNRITQATPVSSGDVLAFGDTEFLIELG